jgi:endonuclease YncB( thermonuclease family)
MRSFLALVLLVTAMAADAKLARVIDGDTLDLAGERIRLWGIDAVEGDQ